jgi:ankyrin repeat protein
MEKKPQTEVKMTKKTFVKEMLDTIRQGDLERVASLLDANRERLHEMTVFGTWLHFAADEGKLEIVKYLISQGLDVNARSETVSSSYTPINAAASEGHAEVVRYLLSQGAALNTHEPDENPLFAAITGGNPEVIKLLLESGIDATVKYNGKNMKNMDALAFACEYGKTEIANILRPHSLGEPVSWDGEGYSMPMIDDCYVHQGWKKFDFQGNRLGLYNSNATKRIAD